jgi:hypothetical protein
MIYFCVLHTFHVAAKCRGSLGKELIAMAQERKALGSNYKNWPVFKRIVSCLVYRSSPAGIQG